VRSSGQAAVPSGRPVASTILLVVTTLIVAANLRPAITSVGSAIGLIADGTGLSEGELGVLGALPLLAFAVVSPLVHRVSRRLGIELTVLIALLVLIAGTVVRSLPGAGPTLWLGSVILGAAIAVCNVLMPAIVKRDFPLTVSFMTGAYTSVISGFAALASGLSVPLGELGGWQLAIGAWAGLSALSALVWTVRVRGAGRPERGASIAPSARGPSMWASAVAWYVTAFMGLQSMAFYLIITWLPTIEASYGVPPAVAGWHLFAFQLTGIVAGLGVTAFMRRRQDQRLVGAVVSIVMIVAMSGVLLAPSWMLMWVVLAGLSSGSAIVVALTLVSLRSRTVHDAGRLSGMVQGVGYLLAALGPVGSGLLYEWTGLWSLPVIALIAISVLQGLVALLAGRDRYTHPAPAS